MDVLQLLQTLVVTTRHDLLARQKLHGGAREPSGAERTGACRVLILAPWSSSTELQTSHVVSSSGFAGPHSDSSY